MATAESILEQYWGYKTFRPLQREIIINVLAGKDTVALLPTGGGKSVCYQVPALMMDGMCLVVSPLIALMQDQVQRLLQLDIPSACIHAGMHYMAVKRTLENAMHGAYKLLYVSPERLQSYLFNEYLPSMSISFIAVDEAHCISQWGHDFRPDYLKIANLRELYDDVPFLALTATATEAVRNDIAYQLKLKQPELFVQSFERKNIEYRVDYTENKNKAVEEALRHNTNAAIIYCRSRRQTEVLVKYLAQEDIEAVAYHAGMKKDTREEAQQQWMANDVKNIVATTAFGMGIDKEDVGLVINYDAPEHLEAYYQESGRAGRNGKAALSVLMYNSIDINRLQESTALQYPDEHFLRHVYQCVAEYLQIPISAEPHTYYPFDLKDFCTKFKLATAATASALKLLEQEGLWTLSEAVFNPPALMFTANRQELDEVADNYPELAYAIAGLLRMYGSLFQYPTAINIYAVAKQLKMRTEDTEVILHRLESLGIATYQKKMEGPQLFFHHFRVDSKQLILDFKRINTLKKRHKERTDAMIAYLQNKDVCRTRLLLQYFNEDKKTDCDHCDVCIKQQSSNTHSASLQEKILAILSTQSPIGIHDIISRFAISDKQNVVDTIRRMADEKLLLLKEDGSISSI